VANKNFKVKSGLNIPIVSAKILTTDSSGDVSSESILAVENGGTGQSSASNAINALLPLQTDNDNKFLQTNGINTQWTKVYYQALKNVGNTVTARKFLNISGATFSDDAGSDTTTITIGGGNAETYALMGVF
jgi:hypothetical protein